MKSEAGKYPVLRFTKEGSSRVEEAVAEEFPLTVVLNDQELVTLLCSPMDLKYLAVGFLLSEGLLAGKDDVAKIVVDDRTGVVRVETRGETDTDRERLFKRLITSGCGRGATFYRAADAEGLTIVDSAAEITPGDIFRLTSEFQHHSQLYLSTHGVHSAALCDGARMEVFYEDLGRHNAVDKVFGRCLLDDISTDGRLLISSGRVSSEILLKVAKRNIPIVVSIAAPTDAAVELADSLGVTLVGSVRGGKMSVYSHDRRVCGDTS
ncbi:MAG: formate dehydrogenase accessory sulfurtransferase FdhD [Dehalococcoidales bacterium]